MNLNPGQCVRRSSVLQSLTWLLRETLVEDTAMYLCERETTCLKCSQQSKYITWSEVYMNKIPRKGEPLLRYLYLIIHLFVPSLIRLLLLLPIGFVYVWLTNIKLDVLNSIVLVMGFVVLSFLVPLIYLGIGKVGEFSVKHSPNRVSFLIVIALNFIFYLFFFLSPQYSVQISDTDGNIMVYVPLVFDVLITSGILIIYAFYGNLYERSQDKKDFEIDTHNKKDTLTDLVSKEVDLNDPEVEEFWSKIKDLHERVHTNFVHALRDLAFSEHDLLGGLLLEAQENKEDNPFETLWTKLGGNLNDGDKDVFIPQLGELENGRNIFIMKMPKVELPIESLYTGFYLDDPEDIRVYTLELMQNGNYALCMWKKNRHYFIKEGVQPDAEDFYQSILSNFDNPKVKGI